MSGEGQCASFTNKDIKHQETAEVSQGTTYGEGKGCTGYTN
jgi:hypothetical protein